jgi:hypothetical protein
MTPRPPHSAPEPAQESEQTARRQKSEEAQVNQSPDAQQQAIGKSRSHRAEQTSSGVRKDHE